MNSQILESIETNELIGEIIMRGDDWEMIDYCKDAGMIYKKDCVDISTLEKGTLKRYLCDIVGVGYHTDVDSVFDLLKEKIQ